jgi:HEAT repeat protein
LSQEALEIKKGGRKMKKYSFLATVLIICFIGSVAADEIDALIKQLKSSKLTQRLAAAKALGEKKDTRAVNPLVSVLKKDANWDVRLAAENALVSIGSPSVEPLVQILKEEKECFVRRRAARALKELRDTCDPRTFKNASQKDNDCFVRRVAARALAEVKHPEAAEFLDDAMKKKNLEIVSAAYAYYIKKGEAGTEGVLIEALWEGCYERKMVFDFAYCGNEKLKQAADEIAKKRGYTIAADWSGPQWGKVN